MELLIRLAVAAVAVLGLAAWAAPLTAEAAGPPGAPHSGAGADHVVFVQTDNTAGNQVVVHDRADNGSLTLGQYLPDRRCRWGAERIGGRPPGLPRLIDL